jgi:hypothetical protein
MKKNISSSIPIASNDTARMIAIFLMTSGDCSVELDPIQSRTAIVSKAIVANQPYSS